MSLAQVQMSTTEFQSLHGHLTSKPHRNMHAREARTQNGHRTLLALHAMYATTPSEIEGMISGPGIFWHYKLTLGGGQTQMRVFAHTPADAARVQRRFLPVILGRAREEQTRTQQPFSNMLPGEFYLRRHLGGMPSSHQNCRNAVAAGALDQRFVSQLQAWNLMVVNP